MTNLLKPYRLFFIIFVILSLSFNCGKKKSTEPKTCFSLTAVSNNLGIVEIMPDSSCYHTGTEVYLTAISGPGNVFTGWTGNIIFSDSAEYDSALIVTVGTGDITITANFQTGYSLTIYYNTASAGSVIVNPDKNLFPADFEIELEAVANPGYEFSHWLFTDDDSLYGYNPIYLTFGQGDEIVTACYITFEGEPDCGYQYEDNYNGGCNSYPNNFLDIGIGQIYSGKSGTYTFVDNDTLWLLRDTDWYEFTTYVDTRFSFSGTGDFLLKLYILYAPNGCDGSIYLLAGDSLLWLPDTVNLVNTGPPGRYFMWIGPWEFENWDCPVNYKVWFKAEAVSGASTPELVEVSKDILNNKQRK